MELERLKTGLEQAEDSQRTHSAQTERHHYHKCESRVKKGWKNSAKEQKM
jgi:hypothetical protein